MQFPWLCFHKQQPKLEDHFKVVLFNMQHSNSFCILFVDMDKPPILQIYKIQNTKKVQCLLQCTYLLILFCCVVWIYKYVLPNRPTHFISPHCTFSDLFTFSIE